jgi:hypothetical protein
LKRLFLIYSECGLPKLYRLNIFMKAILCILFLACTATCYGQQPQAGQGATAEFPKIAHKAKISYKIIHAANKTFGYDILSNGRMLIHQPSVPGQPGNNGFRTKLAAGKVALLVISKIKKGEMPPTVTEAEMKALHAL